VVQATTPSEEGALRVFCALDAIILAMSAVHFLDYEIIRWGKIALLQTLRLSPLITVLAAVSVALWIDRLPTGSIWFAPKVARRTGARLSIAIAVLASVAGVTKTDLVRRATGEEVRRRAVDVGGHVPPHTVAHASGRLFLTPPGNEGSPISPSVRRWSNSR